MSPKQPHQFLVNAFRKKRKVLIKGMPGVGKSDIVDAAAAEAGADCITRHPSVEDPTDAKGMPAIAKSGKEAHFLPFGDLNRMIQAEKLTVVHLEDFGQAPHAVQAAYMQLLLRRAINGTQISPHVVFCASTNDTSHRAGANTVLEPVKSRFDTIVELKPDLDDWCSWAFKAGLPAEIVAFVRFRPELLCKFDPTRELTNSPTPRTVAAVGRWVADGITDPEVLSGAAGQGFAMEFIGFLRVFQSLPSIDQILHDPLGAPVPDNPAALYAVTSALVRKFAKDNGSRVFAYSSRMPKEFEMCLVRDASQTHPAVKGTREYIEWAIRNSAAA
jgi:hypothetical protein